MRVDDLASAASGTSRSRSRRARGGPGGSTRAVRLRAVLAILASGAVLAGGTWYAATLFFVPAWSVELRVFDEIYVGRLGPMEATSSVTVGWGTAVLAGMMWRRRRGRKVRRASRSGRQLYDERLSAAVAQLADENAVTRLAAVHALAGLADDWAAGRQACIDALCSLLRKPARQAAPDAPRGERLACEREREVRRTIVGVIVAHLRRTAPIPWQGYDFDFTGAVFDDGADFAGISLLTGELRFDRAEFTGGVLDFRAAEFAGGVVSFSGGKFSGGMVNFGAAGFSGSVVNFGGVEFSGSDVSFVRAHFSNGLANFYGAKFLGGVVSFGQVRFSGGVVSFGAAGFSGSVVNFGGAEFSGSDVSFVRARLVAGVVNFHAAEFAGGVVSFCRMGFANGVTNFDTARFSAGEVSFSSADFAGGVLNFEDVADWSVPPEFTTTQRSASGLVLPDAERARPAAEPVTSRAGGDDAEGDPPDALTDLEPAGSELP